MESQQPEDAVIIKSEVEENGTMELEDGSGPQSYDDEMDSQGSQTKRNNTCKLCGKSFTRHRSMMRHHRSTHSEHLQHYPYPCKKCESGFSTREELNEHDLLHTKGKQLCCDICGKEFRYPSDLRRHELTHTGEKNFTCTQCNKSFTQQSGLDWHMETHTREKLHTCSICGKAFLRPHQLQRHLMVHTGEKPFMCPDCGKSYTQKDNLQYHQRHSKKCKKALVKDKLVCKLCGHKSEEAVTPCPKCGCMEEPKEVLKQEWGEMPVEVNVGTDGALQKIATHYVKLTGPEGQMKSKVARDPLQSTNPCLEIKEELIDDQPTSIEAELVDGLANIRQENGGELQYRVINDQYAVSASKTFPCTDCGKSFTQKVNLKRHQQRACKNGTFKLPHNNDQVKSKDFHCSQCNKTFTCPYNRNRHEREHSGERLFPCDKCDKSFSRKVNLDKHLRSHRAYPCHKCDRSFAIPEKLERHLKNNHEKEFPSELTDYGLIIKEELVDDNTTSIELKKLSEVTAKGVQKEDCGVIPIKVKAEPEDIPTSNQSPGELFLHDEPIESNGTNKFHCSICNKTFSNLSSRNRHEKDHSGLKPFACDKCDKAFSHQHHLEKHLKSHRAFPCTKCDRSYALQDELEKHLKICSVFHCSYCNKSFTGKYSLKQHEKGVCKHKKLEEVKGSGVQKGDCAATSIEVKVEPEEPMKSTGTKNFYCSICNKAFGNSFSRNRHEKDHSGIKPFTCNQCGKAFSHSHHLDKHLQSHRAFQCHMCERSFALQEKLENHLKSYHKKKNALLPDKPSLQIKVEPMDGQPCLEDPSAIFEDLMAIKSEPTQDT